MPGHCCKEDDKTRDMSPTKHYQVNLHGFVASTEAPLNIVYTEQLWVSRLSSYCMLINLGWRLFAVSWYLQCRDTYRTRIVQHFHFWGACCFCGLAILICCNVQRLTDSPRIPRGWRKFALTADDLTADDAYFTLLYLICGKLQPSWAPHLCKASQQKPNRSHTESDHHRLAIKNLLKISCEICIYYQYQSQHTL